MASQIDSINAHKQLISDANSFLIDVRTHEEFNFVGIVDDNGFKNKITLMPWLLFPNMNINPDFLENIKKLFPNIDSNLFFLCKTGGRSNQSSLAVNEIGYKNCYNIVNGFEGDLDSFEHRGNINGWKASKLPWRQK